MQTKAELEEFYKTPDPWGYTTNDDDYLRRNIIFEVKRLLRGRTDRALELGAGEGFLTWPLSWVSERVEYIELSDIAAKRLEDSVTGSLGCKRVKKPSGKYDFILAAGVLYEQYNYKQMRQWIEYCASDIVLTCHYSEAGKVHDKFDKEQIFYAEFPYRKGKQIMRVYQW